jgi:hypothetical protein
VLISRIRSLKAVLLVFMIMALAVSAQASFTNASLKGSYSYLINRWTADSTINESAYGGVVTCDGAGNVSATYLDMSGGVETTGTESGTYTVNANGTGTIDFTTGGTNHFAMVLNSTAAGLAHGLLLLRTDNTTNLVESGTALLQSTTAATFTLASLKGIMSFQLAKWTAAVSDTQEGIFGILSFNGAGKVTGSFTSMVGGVVKTATLTGTYTVNSDGSGSMSWTFSGVTRQLAFALNNATPTTPAKGLQILQTTSTGNEVISGGALKQ